MVVLRGQCLKQIIRICPKRIQLHLAFSFVQCKALEVSHKLYVTHTKARTQNTPKAVLGISLTHIKNFSGNSAKGMSPRFSFLLAIKQGPAGVVPSRAPDSLSFLLWSRDQPGWCHPQEDRNLPSAGRDRLWAQSSSCDGLCTGGLAKGQTWECWP